MKNTDKQNGILYRAESGCEMYLVIGRWNEAKKKANFHWVMKSAKTGTHEIITQSNRPDNRVDAHWSGFLQNQAR